MFADLYIETERLIIRPFEDNDRNAFASIVSQERVVEYLPENVMSPSQAGRIFDWLRECYRKNKPDRIIKYTLAVVFKANHRVIGWCGFGPLDFNPVEIELYYGLSEDYWGRGLATEAARAILNFGFDTVGLDKIVAVVSPQNTATGSLPRARSITI